MNHFLEQKSEKALIGDNSSTVVNLENSLIVEILGVNNENLDFCEKKLKVKVLQKGNIVIITGNKKERYIVRNSIIQLSRELKDPIKKNQNTFKEILNMQINNDLDNIGFTTRHHSFFEMLGNFSFGDYFKEEAIHYAWDFLTNDLKLDSKKLYVSVHESDDVSKDIWLNNIKVDPDKVLVLGDEDNFWQMGDTGPCGPCTEIYYDLGSKYDGVLPTEGVPKDRYIDIWNLVFTQYNKTSSGNLEELPQKCVDTGMGLELSLIHI